MTNATLERTAPTQNASATYMPQAQGQAADRRIKEKAPTDAISVFFISYFFIVNELFINETIS